MSSSVAWLIVGSVFLIVILNSIISGNKKQKKRALQIEEAKKQQAIKSEEAKNKVISAFDGNKILEAQKDKLLEILTTKGVQPDFESNLLYYEKRKLKLDFLVEKYGTDIGEKLFIDEYWIGMTVEQLTDTKGQPTRIEKEELKTKTKNTYIYGNKSSGDYFVIENGLVVKLVDR